MEEREVRALFFEQWAKRTDGDMQEAVAQTYFGVALRIVAALDVPSDDEFYWRAVNLVLQLKTDLGRKEMYPGPPDLDPVPMCGRDEPVLYRVLDAEHDVLVYIRNHLRTLPPSPLRDSMTTDMIDAGLRTRRTEYDSIVRQFNTKQYAWVPRRIIDGLAAQVDNLLQALLGTDACEQFCRRFNRANAWIRQEQDRPAGRFLS